MLVIGLTMRALTRIVFIGLFLAASISAQTSDQASPSPFPGISRIEAMPSAGFSYPYYLYVPPSFFTVTAKDRVNNILVIPNNTGKNSDDLSIHEADVIRRMGQNSRFVSGLDVAILTPVFPRPESDWKTYTHALDRDTLMLSKESNKDYVRLDLQLIAMIDDARAKLLKDAALKTDSRVLMLGFSASGMFVNRFTFLHPERVKAAIAGSPGGWPIAPSDTYGTSRLRYPIGVADLNLVSGRALDIKALQKVPLFLFLGDKDDNDSVPFDDSYDKDDRELVYAMFGKKPLDRWKTAKELYKNAGLQATFKLYPDTGHTITPAIRDDIVAFIAKHCN